MDTYIYIYFNSQIDQNLSWKVIWNWLDLYIITHFPRSADCRVWRRKHSGRLSMCWNKNKLLIRCFWLIYSCSFLVTTWLENTLISSTQKKIIILILIDAVVCSHEMRGHFWCGAVGTGWTSAAVGVLPAPFLVAEEGGHLDIQI